MTQLQCSFYFLRNVPEVMGYGIECGFKHLQLTCKSYHYNFQIHRFSAVISGKCFLIFVYVHRNLEVFYFTRIVTEGFVFEVRER